MKRRRLAMALSGAAAAYAALHASDRRKVAGDPNAIPEVPLGRATVARSADGTEISTHISDGPDGAPTVVLSHGWTCSARFWLPQVAALRGEIRLVTYDQRGHGNSRVDRGAIFATRHLAEDLQAVLDAALRDGEKAVLVGHSMGAMAIAAWADRYPDQVEARARAVLLASTGVFELSTRGRIVPLPSEAMRVRRLAGRVFLTWPLPLGPASPVTHRGLRHALLSRTATPAQVAFCEELIVSCPAHVRAGWGAALMSLDLRHALARITVPTVFLYGEQDRLTPQEHVDEIVGSLPKLDRVVALPGIGHMTPVEAAARFNDEIRRLAAGSTA